MSQYSLEFLHWRLPAGRKMAQGSPRPYPFRGRDSALPEDHRGPYGNGSHHAAD